MTGAASAKHEIISIQTMSLKDVAGGGSASSYITTSNTAGYSDQTQKVYPKIDSSPLGWFFYFVMFMIVIIVAYVGWNIHQQSKQQFKRF